jgi:putative FmdB family regulatory protein
MPTYAYECAACGHGLEEFQTMTAKPLRKCPACKALKLKRLIGPGAGFIFKGTGFYITDYRSENYKEAAKKESGATKPAGDSKPKPAADAKPAAKSESKPARTAGK